jgi:hypothetical protein
LAYAGRSPEAARRRNPAPGADMGPRAPPPARTRVAKEGAEPTWQSGDVAGDATATKSMSCTVDVRPLQRSPKSVEWAPTHTPPSEKAEEGIGSPDRAGVEVEPDFACFSRQLAEAHTPP